MALAGDSFACWPMTHHVAMTSVSASRAIAAPAEGVFALVADLSRMGEWSPENLGGRWIKGATGPARGARFRGHNRNGRRSWTTTSHVVEFEPPTRFAFNVTAGPAKISRWEYRIEPTSSGCTVTETWTDQRNLLIAKLAGVVTGVANRPTFTRTSIETTLERLDKTATI
jgi:uncharacterized protein YndB with AHSA1/START domain